MAAHIITYKGYSIVAKSGVTEEGDNKFLFGVVRKSPKLTSYESELIYDSAAQAKEEAKHYIDLFLTDYS